MLHIYAFIILIEISTILHRDAFHVKNQHKTGIYSMIIQDTCTCRRWAMQIITDDTNKEIKAHGSHPFPLLVSYEKITAYDSGSFHWHWLPAERCCTESIIRNTMSKRAMQYSPMPMPCIQELCIRIRIVPIFL